MRPAVKRTLLRIALAILLAGAFAAYLQPSFIVDLATRIVLCF
jgi:predicted MFS family arabinose efflux permease